MRDAGEGIADWVDRIIPGNRHHARRALALAGPGNNGGDALVALAALHGRAWECAVLLVDRGGFGQLPASNSALAALRLVRPNEALNWQPDVVLDGIYGIGGRADLSEHAREALQLARTLRDEYCTPLVAIDLPSGTDGATGAADAEAFPADVTLCLGLPKLGLIKEPAATRVGELVILDIGLDVPDANGRPMLLDARQARGLVPNRKAGAHKTDAGAALVVGGAHSYYGAPRLAGGAALRAGAGLVCVAAPQEIVPTIVTQVPELTVIPLSGDGANQIAQLDNALNAQRDRFSAFVVGPGLGRDARASSLCEWILDTQNRHFQRGHLVLDADALFWLAGRGDVRSRLAGRRCVLTPHAGEMARLKNCAVDDVRRDPLAVATESARAWGQVVVLKTGYSIVAAPNGGVWVAPRSMPELATAGTGDVLAGMIGGLLAQGLNTIDAARLAMYLGALAGRAARAVHGVHGVIAEDVIEGVPRTMRELSEPRWDHSWLADPSG
jgi:NAD(P)H-hydrate epimerase